jgi:tRNA-splicing ligase RtcB (3'-phosphate/5'-hydroxy nucleic acid ligase)
MYAYKNEDTVPVKIYSERGTIEKAAISQLENAARLPFAFHHVALMPDGHVALSGQ